MKISRPALFLFFLFSTFFLNAQVVLPYNLNSDKLPDDTAKIAQVQSIRGISPGMFVANGFQPGDVVPDFTLFDTTGKACRLSLLLAEGKPVLLIAISLTCPQSRASVINPLRMINKAYGKQINIRLIYTIDAHPASPDICPYTGNTFTTQNNISDSILFHQPTTYLERKQMAENFAKRFPLKIPILIDDPENDYWKTFGPAPNNAYLLTPSGMVFRKYPWFEEARQRIPGDAPSLLGDSSFMKTNTSKEVWIGKSKTTSHTTLFVSAATHYSITVFDVTGKSVFKKENIPTMEFDLEKIPLEKGEYALVIQDTAGRGYCVHYSRN